MKASMRWFSVALLIVMVACNGGGSVRGMYGTCRTAGSEGECEGGFRQLSGRYIHRIEATRHYRMGDEVFVEAWVSVEEGRVMVIIEAPDGVDIAAEAAPGEPASIAGLTTTGRMSEEVHVPIIYEALEETVTGVEYHVTFREP